MLPSLKIKLAFIAAFGVAGFFAENSAAQEKSIVVASTIATENSGLFRHLLPVFAQKTGIAVKVLAQHSTQALETGRQGQADVIFVHAKFAEQKFVAEGDGVTRFPVMYNDYVLVGPANDPAGIKGMTDITRALRAIQEKRLSFISRGDHSRTHRDELALWNKDVGVNIEKERGPWYRSIGANMGTALDKAATEHAYTLSDRATWSAFKKRGDLQILVEGDKRLFKQYSVILVNPQKHPGVKRDLGQKFIDWLVSPEGQKAIADYKINGEQLFFPNATDPNA